MAKKRRTRAQKERAIRHRQQQLTQTAKTAQTPTITTQSHNAPESKTAPAIPEDGGFQRRDLRTSLRLLVILVSAQVALWLVFMLTELDENLYRLMSG